MASLDARPSELGPVFVGREREMEWLFDRFRRPGAPIVISGPPGVGKTALLKQFLATARVRRPPLVLTMRYRPDESMIEISEKIDELYRDRNPPEIVAIDEAETLDERQLNIITGRVLNLKAVRTLIFVTRRQPKITRAEVLQLQPLSAADAQNMLQSLLGTDLPREEISRAVEAASGLPLALGLLAELVRGRDPQEIQRLLRGRSTISIGSSSFQKGN